MALKERVALVHPFLAQLGGGEYLAFVTARILKDRGYDVTIYTLTQVDKSKVESFLGFSVSDIDIEKLEVELPAPLHEVMHGKQSKYLKAILSTDLESRIDELFREYDIVFDTQADLIIPSDIAYVHFPWLAPEPQDGERYAKLFERLIEPILAKLRRAKILTNSSWSAAYVRRYYSLFPDVVYPPVDVERIQKVCQNCEKEDFVLTISRFSPEKNVMSVVKVARKLRYMNFVIVGNAQTYESKLVLEQIREFMEMHGMDNVELMVNVDRSTLLKLLCKASLYLHPMYTEHFGISVVEAMAGGAVPVVYRDGGAWYDIVSKVSLNLGYSSIDEAAYILSRLHNNKDLQEKLRNRARAVSMQFGISSYSEKVSSIVDYVAQVKRIERKSFGI